MVDLLLFLVLSSAGALVLGLVYLLFEIFLFTVYKMDGGRLDLISYFKKL